MGNYFLMSHTVIFDKYAEKALEKNRIDADTHGFEFKASLFGRIKVYLPLDFFTRR